MCGSWKRSFLGTRLWFQEFFMGRPLDSYSMCGMITAYHKNICLTKEKFERNEDKTAN